MLKKFKNEFYLKEKTYLYLRNYLLNFEKLKFIHSHLELTFLQNTLILSNTLSGAKVSFYIAINKSGILFILKTLSLSVIRFF